MRFRLTDIKEVISGYKSVEAATDAASTDLAASEQEEAKNEPQQIAIKSDSQNEEKTENTYVGNNSAECELVASIDKKAQQVRLPIHDLVEGLPEIITVDLEQIPQSYGVKTTHVLPNREIPLSGELGETSSVDTQGNMVSTPLKATSNPIKDRDADKELGVVEGSHNSAKPVEQTSDVAKPSLTSATMPEIKAVKKREEQSNVPDNVAQRTNINMANVKQSIDELMKIDGVMACAVVDSESGMALGTAGSGIQLEVAAAGNSEVVRAKHRVMEELGLNDSIEDILITLSSQYHLIRPLSKAPSLFIYLVLNKKQANLAMSRHKLSAIESTMEV